MTGRIFLCAVKATVRLIIPYLIVWLNYTLSDSFRSLARLSNFTHLRNLYEKSLEEAQDAGGMEEGECLNKHHIC